MMYVRHFCNHCTFIPPLTLFFVILCFIFFSTAWYHSAHGHSYHRLWKCALSNQIFSCFYQQNKFSMLIFLQIHISDLSSFFRRSTGASIFPLQPKLSCFKSALYFSRMKQYNYYHYNSTVAPAFYLLCALFCHHIFHFIFLQPHQAAAFFNFQIYVTIFCNVELRNLNFVALCCYIVCLRQQHIDIHYKSASFPTSILQFSF